MRLVSFGPALLFILCGSIAALGCAPHGDELQPLIQVAEPAIVNDAEPPARVPPIVALPLPELVPIRPLAHLAPLWHHLEGDGPAPTSVMAIGEAAVAIRPADAAALGITGAPVDLEALALPASSPIRWAGPLLLLNSSTSFTAAVSPADVAWITPDGPMRSYLQVVSPSTLVASFYEPDADRLVAWSLHDGREEWSLSGSSTMGFTRVKALWTDATRGYLLGDGGLLVFDPVTGAMLWDASVAEADCGVATGEGFVVIEDPAGHRLLDAETGTQSARFLGTGGLHCGWMAYSYDGVAPGVIAEGRLVAFDSVPPVDGSSPLRGFDLSSQRELWHAEGFDDDFVRVDHDAVYVTRANDEILLALDAGTGTPQAEISIGTSFDLTIEPVGGAAGPLVVIRDNEAGQWILGRTEAKPTLESYVIQGRLVPIEGMARRRIADVRLRVGEQIVKTDKRGRFSARGSALGAITVMRGDDFYEYQDEPYEYLRVAIDPRRVVLEGKGTYDLGDIPAYEIATE